MLLSQKCLRFRAFFQFTGGSLLILHLHIQAKRGVIHGKIKGRFHIPELRKYYVKGTKNVGKCTKLGQILLKICSLFS